MNKPLHDLRNDLAVALGSVQAFIDGKLDPDEQNLADVLEALEDVNAKLDALPWSSGEDRENSDLLGAMIEGAPYAKVLVDDRGRIALVNELAERLFGYPRSEMLGASIEMLVPDRFRGGHSHLRGSYAAHPTARPMGMGRDLYARRKDGTEVPVEIGLNPIVTRAGAFTLAAITDITERKRTEELRLVNDRIQRHAADLEELNRELAAASRFKTQFVSTMSHELRTPLTAIVGAAELLHDVQLNERDRTIAVTIEEAAEALLALTNSILDFSKIEAGKLDLTVADVSIEAVVEGAAGVLAQLARDKGLTLHTYVDPMIPRVRGDADRLRQVLLNLLGNAVKFTDRGRVVARALPVSVAVGSLTIRFDVQDTGIGIPPESVPTLFEPFAQGAHSAAGSHGGTGLGLSISKRIVELMGGQIGAQSEPGVGSLFWFTVRLEPAEPSAAASLRVLENMGAVTLTKDDVFAQIVDGYLRSWSMATRRVRNATEMLGALQSGDERTWVAIVDLDDGAGEMPRELEHLRPLVARRLIPIGRAGLQKPVRQSQLFDAIVHAVEPGPRPAPPPPRPAGQAQKPAVLVAEDNMRLQRLLKLQFDQLGVSATFVSDGEGAVEAVRSNDYALVFMDNHMPNMDGLTAAKLIREQERSSGRHVPIAAMTADAFAEDREACIAAGMDDYLAKPVKLADLRGAIERWIPSTRC